MIYLGMPFYGRVLGRRMGTSGGSSGTSVPSAPLYASGEVGNVNATTVVITFNQSVAASDYALGVVIKNGAVTQTINIADRQANHAVVHFDIDDAVLFGDVVTWEYAKATGDYAGEVGAIEMENVTAQTVTQNVSPSLQFNNQFNGMYVPVI